MKGAMGIKRHGLRGSKRGSVQLRLRTEIVGLLPQMSNEIIRLCCHAISLDRIFEGYVISSKEDP